MTETGNALGARTPFRSFLLFRFGACFGFRASDFVLSALRRCPAKRRYFVARMHTAAGLTLAAISSADRLAPSSLPASALTLFLSRNLRMWPALMPRP